MKKKKESAKNTPPLTDAEKREYIDKHLFDGIRYLLSAATEWSIQDQLKLEIPGYEIQVYAMDSVFVRARSLFEFFVLPTTKNHYGVDKFLGAGFQLKSTNYENWKGPLHAFLMHAQCRSKPEQLETSDGMKDLNQMPVYFAREILILWEDFETRLMSCSGARNQELGKLAREKRLDAIGKSKCALNSTVAQKHAEERGVVLRLEFTE